MQNKISLSLFISIVIFVSIFTGLLVFNTKSYDFFSREDHIIEYLSSFFLLFSSLFFFRALIYSKKDTPTNKIEWRSFLLIILSILFFVAAGEEISWGQRIFNIQTPEYLSHINDQNELNIHNINKKFFDRVLDRFTIIFTVIGSVLVLFKKDVVFGVKKPDILIICAFAITPFYEQNNELDFYHIQYLPLIGLLIYSIINKFKISAFVLTATLIISFLIPIMHTKFNHLFPSHNNSADEYREFLFCLCCLFYSYMIMDKIKLDKTKNK